MKLELTSEQYKLIQNEIIILEDELADNRDKMNGWDISNILGEISILKEILFSEKIDLNKML